MICAACGHYPCECTWRDLERFRLAMLESIGQPVRGVTWKCEHAAHSSSGGLGSARYFGQRDRPRG